MSFKDRYVYLLKDESVKHVIAYADTIEQLYLIGSAFKMTKSHKYGVYDFNVRTGEQRRIERFYGGK